MSKAESWASDLPDMATAEGPGVRIVENGTDGVLVFAFDGKLTGAGTDQVFAAFAKVL